MPEQREKNVSPRTMMAMMVEEGCYIVKTTAAPADIYLGRRQESATNTECFPETKDSVCSAASYKKGVCWKAKERLGEARREARDPKAAG